MTWGSILVAPALLRPSLAAAAAAVAASASASASASAPPHGPSIRMPTTRSPPPSLLGLGNSRMALISMPRHTAAVTTAHGVQTTTAITKGAAAAAAAAAMPHSSHGSSRSSSKLCSFHYLAGSCWPAMWQRFCFLGWPTGEAHWAFPPTHVDSTRLLDSLCLIWTPSFCATSWAGLHSLCLPPKPCLTTNPALLVLPHVQGALQVGDHPPLRLCLLSGTSPDLWLRGHLLWGAGPALEVGGRSGAG